MEKIDKYPHAYIVDRYAGQLIIKDIKVTGDCNIKMEVDYSTYMVNESPKERIKVLKPHTFSLNPHEEMIIKPGNTYWFSCIKGTRIRIIDAHYNKLNGINIFLGDIYGEDTPLNQQVTKDDIQKFKDKIKDIKIGLSR